MPIRSRVVVEETLPPFTLAAVAIYFEMLRTAKLTVDGERIPLVVTRRVEVLAIQAGVLEAAWRCDLIAMLTVAKLALSDERPLAEFAEAIDEESGDIIKQVSLALREHAATGRALYYPEPTKREQQQTRPDGLN